MIVACNRNLGQQGSPVTEFYTSWLIFPSFINHTDHHCISMACSQGISPTTAVTGYAIGLKKLSASQLIGFHWTWSGLKLPQTTQIISVHSSLITVHNAYASIRAKIVWTEMKPILSHPKQMHIMFTCVTCVHQHYVASNHSTQTYRKLCSYNTRFIMGDYDRCIEIRSTLSIAYPITAEVGGMVPESDNKP